MTDLIAFLTARLDEDEAVAHRVKSTWRQDGKTGVILASDGTYAEACGAGYWDGIAEHIVRHDPARVLCDVAGGRAIIAQYQAAAAAAAAETDTEEGWIADRVLDALAGVIRTLVAAHAGHPDYNSDWRPE